MVNPEDIATYHFILSVEQAEELDVTTIRLMVMTLCKLLVAVDFPRESLEEITGEKSFTLDALNKVFKGVEMEFHPGTSFPGIT